jgi:hypothetical protein
MSNQSSTDGAGCGCVSIILAVILFTMLWFGLPTPWGKLNLDIFPPRIWDMEQEGGAE